MDEMVMIVAINGILWPCVMVMVITYVYFNHRTKVRLALIESGRDASIFKTQPQITRLRTLKQGILLLMAGVGLLFGGLLNAMGLDEDVAYFAGLFAMTGMGLVAFYLYTGQTQRELVEDSDLI
jgi:hypothetical protein